MQNWKNQKKEFVLKCGEIQMVQPRKAVIDMAPYNPPLEGRKGFLRLDFNENTLGPGSAVLKALKRINCDDLSAYPEYGGLRRKIARLAKVKEENVLMSNGSDEGIKTVMQTFVSEGNKVIIPTPSFAMFYFYAELMGAKIGRILYNVDLSFPTEKVLNSIDSNTRVVILCNPNNPTGTVIPRRDIVKIVEKCGENNCIALIDEAYSEFNRKIATDLICKYENVVILRTLSKAFGLGGLRFGYAIACPEKIALMKKTISPYSISTPTVIAVNAALDDKKYVEKYANEVLMAKKFFEKELKNLGLEFFPSGGNFVLIRFGKSSRLVQKKFRERKILVRDRSGDDLLQGCVRISIGTLKQMKLVAGELKKILKEIEKGNK